MITYLTHDLTKTTRGVVAHGCNCQGVMGSGVAKAIRATWPIAYERYKSVADGYKQAKQSPLGLACIVNVGDDDAPINSLFVSNMFTQEFYGGDGRRYADPAAIETALRATLVFCNGADLPLYMPKIGCGLGGLSWTTEVMPIVIELSAEYGRDIFVCDL